MNKITLNRTYILVLLFCSSALFCQSSGTETVRELIPVNILNSYKISSLNIVPSSEIIILHQDTLSRSQYNFDFVNGTFSLSPDLNYSLLDTLELSYLTIKLNLKKEYKRRDLVVQYDDRYPDTTRTLKRISEPLTSDLIFGKELHKSGAIIRGFTIGTNRDFTLNSGLRLQLSGRLSDEIEIVAALTDENTPIQPEGNTEKLDELDKVFIELKHQNATGTFGDYELNLRENEFSQVTRKLQGLKGESIYGSTKGTIAIAGSRGKFNTNQYNGLDGNQGPYRLSGINNERAIIIIAGSEQVYLDGQEMKRGENNDYIIDYSNAQIIFTPKRLITSATRISVDFEYTDQNYKRNFFGADFSTLLFEEKVKIGVGYFREGDDENSPIEFSFTDEELNILKSAGNNRNASVKQGVSLAPPDSLGRLQGTYLKIDTLINGTPYTYYRYLPGASSSVYNVSFTYVGEGSGDYVKESLGKYRFAGINKGTYLPLIFLPMPELKQLGNLSVSANLIEGLKVSAELSGSSWDRNKFSSINDDNNFGYARKLFLELNQREIKLGNLSLGRLGFTIKDRYIQGRFASLDRINDVEFSRNYNLPSAVQSDQTLREFALNYSPVQNLSLYSKYGILKQGNEFNSDRLYSKLILSDQKDYHLNVTLDYVSSKNNNINSNWLRNDGFAFYQFGVLKSGFEYNYENKEDKISALNDLLATSLRYIEAAPFVEFNFSSALDARIRLSKRDESFPLNGQLLKQSSSTTEQLQLNYRGLKEFSTSVSLGLRDKKYTDGFRKSGYTDNETILLLSQSRLNLWNGFISGDIFYQASTEQSARLEKVFVKVQKGSGSYIYLGDLNNNGIAEESEFQPAAYDGDFVIVTTPTEQLFPVIALKTNFRFRIEYNRIISGDDFWQNILKPVSTETSFRIEESSKTETAKDIYLLNFSKFLNDSSTIHGSQIFQNDFNLFQNSNDLSFRFRFTQRKSFNQFSAGNEKGFFRERSLRLRIKLIEEISNQTEFLNQTDNLISPAVTNRARLVTRNNISTDFSYRPQQNLEVGFKIETGSSVDDYRATPSTISLNSFTLRLNLSFENVGRLRIEGERTELISSSNNAELPYEMTRGQSIGKNYFLRVYFDYRLSGFVQTSFGYDARLQGAGRVIQTMKAEARAYF
ncbi:MAG: hypothetical protein CVV24_06260 [Ignavibacteriae bacterium HGW-Ignavibacteriae-3]|nr:MAG: hypothetical protein CVV24_06260 [Ignavibacteriae bacterium HGW-Ignavibacteriae-3]